VEDLLYKTLDEGVADITALYHTIKNILYIAINLFYKIIKAEKYTKLIFNHNTILHGHNELLKIIIT